MAEPSVAGTPCAWPVMPIWLETSTEVNGALTRKPALLASSYQSASGNALEIACFNFEAFWDRGVTRNTAISRGVYVWLPVDSVDNLGQITLKQVVASVGK